MSLFERAVGSAIDDRTVAEQLRDLGLEVITNRPPPTQVTGVAWVKKNKWTRRKKIGPHVTICKHHLYFNVTATELLSPVTKHFQIGGAKIGGRKGIIIREVKAGGYKISIVDQKGRTSVYSMTAAPGLLKQLADYGLKRGRYELVKAEGYEGVWLGVPEEGVEK